MSQRFQLHLILATPIARFSILLADTPPSGRDQRRLPRESNPRKSYPRKSETRLLGQSGLNAWQREGLLPLPVES
jgi:hypothetical protein